MVIYCISDFVFCGAALPAPAIRSFQNMLRARTGPRRLQDWSESFWYFEGRHNQFSKLCLDSSRHLSVRYRVLLYWKHLRIVLYGWRSA